MPSKSESPDWGNDSADVSALIQRHRYIGSWPSFDAIRQYEWIRAEGKFNMVTQAADVQQEMLKLGFFDALEWLLTCKENRAPFSNLYTDAMAHYRKETPYVKWFDRAFRANIHKSKISALQEQIRKLQAEEKGLLRGTE